MPRPCRGRGGAGRARRRGDARQAPRRASTRTDRDNASGRREPRPPACHGRHGPGGGTSKERRRVRVLWNCSLVRRRPSGREPERTPAGAGRWLAFASSETGLARASGSFVPRLLSSDPPRLSRVKRFLSPREKIQAVTEIFGFGSASSPPDPGHPQPDSQLSVAFRAVQRCMLHFLVTFFGRARSGHRHSRGGRWRATAGPRIRGSSPRPAARMASTTSRCASKPSFRLPRPERPPTRCYRAEISRTPRTKPLRRRLRDAEASPLASLVPRT